MKQQLRDIVKEHAGQKNFQLFFFGSRVKNKDIDDRADVDVGFLGEGKLSWRAFRKIREGIDNIRTLYKIDFVDFNRVSDDFREEALKHISPIS